MDLGITGKRAIVAAGTAGLGLATAVSLASNGARVVVCGRDDKRLQSAIEKIGHGCIGIRHDVSTHESAMDFVRAAIEVLGGVDILVTNGGGPPPGTALDTPIDKYPAALELSLLSVIGMCQVALPYMREQKWGRIVAITSISVKQPIANLALSNTARAGVTGYLKSLARDVAGDGVTVNSVQPGIHLTDRIKDVSGNTLSAEAFGIPAGFLGDPSDFGEICAFFASEQARYITGAHLNVDGGQYAGLQ
ncbi:MAG: SDR family oxidoreductase [Actinobacteria bacterium]|nr:SDR family oxidoreductase [Actinomycetota bacterium]